MCLLTFQNPNIEIRAVQIPDVFSENSIENRGNERLEHLFLEILAAVIK